MHYGYGVALAAWMVVTSAHAAEGEKALNPQVMAVMVSATGDVTTVSYESQAPASIRALVESAVREWKFAPHMVDGHAVPWATRLDVRLMAEPGPEGYRLRVLRAETHNLEITRFYPPSVPIGASRTLKNALMCAEVSVGPDGKTPALGTVWVDDIEVGEDNPYRREVRKAVKRWRIEGIEIAGQRWPAGIMRVPIAASGNGGPELADLAFAMRCGAKAKPRAGFGLTTNVEGMLLTPAPSTRK